MTFLPTFPGPPFALAGAGPGPPSRLVGVGAQSDAGRRRVAHFLIVPDSPNPAHHPSTLSLSSVFIVSDAAPWHNKCLTLLETFLPPLTKVDALSLP